MKKEMSEQKRASLSPNNVVRLPIKDDEFFNVWLLMLRPFHGLTGKEMNVAASLLRRRERMNDVIKDPTLADEALLSSSERVRLCDEFSMTDTHLRVILSKLRKSGFLVGDRINLRFVPDRDPASDRFCLMFDFVIDNNERGNENTGEACVGKD